jgi:salicylate hydroxylase
MAPHQGAGAGQSIEDAYVLAALLGHPRTTLNTISRALTIYDTVRQPFANKVAEQSRLNGQYFTFYGHDHDSGDASREKLQSLAGAFTRCWEWSWTTTVDGALKDALKMLESS